MFGGDDWDLLKCFKQRNANTFYTADKERLSITQKRVEEECGYNLSLVSGNPKERWSWICESILA